MARRPMELGRGHRYPVSCVMSFEPNTGCVRGAVLLDDQPGSRAAPTSSRCRLVLP
jgi:hypothetical protein